LKFNSRTSVDRFLAEMLLSTPIECYVINGKYPERLETILAGRKTTGTMISAKT
jgi:aspartokinase-like uncharacterized kinase